MVKQREKQRDEKDKYSVWKQHLPIMYDWILNHNLVWPSQSCRWGQHMDDFKYKRRQKLYLSDRTDGTELNKLSVWTVDVVKPRVAGSEALKYDEKSKSTHIKPYTTILHPGEVNKIRECPQYPHIVVTHTDEKELYVWDIEKQPNRAMDKGSDKQKLSVADLVLTGHTDLAQFALGMSSAEPLVASGGMDTNVLVWNLADYDGGSWLSDSRAGATDASGPALYKSPAPTLAAKIKLRGHEKTVEDVVWRPGSNAELASVGDDFKLLLWDTRSPNQAAAEVTEAHGRGKDLHCVDWSALQPHLLVTGAADGSVRVWDRRTLAEPLHHFQTHDKPIMRVEWAPYKAGVFASGGEDHLIAVWDLERRGDIGGEGEAQPEPKRARTAIPPQLMFQHAGHRSQVVDFQWHKDDPYTMVSVSESGEGGTLQAWRISDLIWRPFDEVLAELDKHREFILHGKESQASASTAVKLAATTSTANGGSPAAAADPPSVADTVVAPAAPAGATSAGAARSLAAAAAVSTELKNEEMKEEVDNEEEGGCWQSR